MTNDDLKCSLIQRFPVFFELCSRILLGDLMNALTFCSKKSSWLKFFLYLATISFRQVFLIIGSQISLNIFGMYLLGFKCFAKLSLNFIISWLSSAAVFRCGLVTLFTRMGFYLEYCDLFPSFLSAIFSNKYFYVIWYQNYKILQIFGIHTQYWCVLATPS